MRLSVTFISGFWLISAVLARRHHGSSPHRQSRPHSQLTNSASSENWAGAILSGENFTGISAVFPVPKPSSQNSAASVWVGIDGTQGCGNLLQTGVDLIVQEDNSVGYGAWFEWYPADYAQFFDNFTISTGDDIRLTVSVFDEMSGRVQIDDLTTNQTAWANLEVKNSAYALCRTSAEWIVEDYKQGDSLVPFTNFGTVAFTDMVVNSTSGACSSLNADLSNIVHNGQTLTTTWMDEFTIIVAHV